ncbi:MAG: DUF3800 domain-containing protein [Blautia sp.]|nr:DUF3800 domain-containing protein [Blautia sp.]
MQDEKQQIYINLDDSGKLTTKEKISVYGGLVFFSKAEKDKFITQYRSIIDSIKCKYCDHRNNCNHSCPEIKNTNIESKHKRRIMNYLKKYYVVALVINNQKVYGHIINDKAARGRFSDYSLRRMIKTIVKRLIQSNSINPWDSLKIIINIDEQSTKSNGYYNLHDGLMEELKYGISNYNYSAIFPPIIYGDLSIDVSYIDSANSYVVQAADLMAGTIRREAIDALENNKNIYEELSKIAQFVMILP